MAINTAHWTVDRALGDIRYIGPDHEIGGESYATVIEFHRWLQDLADDASSAGDDELDITDELPSARSTDNIIKLLGNYNINDNAAEHLYDGSIIQGAVGVDQIIYDGVVNFGNAGIVIQIHQDGAVLADDWWNMSSGLNANLAQGISHRFMIKTHDFVVDGGDIDGRRIIGTTREFGKTYGEFSINGTSRGNNVLALVNASDLNNVTIIGTVAGYTGINNTTEGYKLLDVNNNSVDEEYYSEWNTNQPTRSINDFYERMKWLTRDGSVSTLYGLNGELFRGITHEIAIDTNTGTFNAFESVSWGTGATAGTGQMLAIDSPTAGTKMWIQLLTGVIPTDGLVITGGTSAATAAMNVTITERTISKPFIGASTGSAIIGGYGVGIETNDLSSTDKVTDLGTNVITPPNNVTFSAGGVVSGEDRVLVGPWNGVAVDNEGNPAIQKDQLTTTAVIINGVAVTSIPVTVSIPSDTPATGDIRVLLASGKYREISYTSWNGSTFTIPSTDFSGDVVNVSSNLWIAYIDTLATIYTLSTALTGAAETSVVVAQTIAGTVPASGNLTVALDDGTTLTVAYSAYVGSTYTITSTDFSGANQASVGNGVYDDGPVAITSESFTSVYLADRDLVVIVRDGGGSPIKQFITSATLGVNGGSVTAIRTTDQ